MQVVIEIDEERYKDILRIADVQLESKRFKTGEQIIAKGTPLPKNHGRLVDMSEVLIKLMQFYDGDKSIGQCLDEVNTIIEADRAERSDKG